MNYEEDDTTAIMNIELALIKFDGVLWGEVKQQLKKRHDSGFEICLDHPEYLREILMEICGDSYPEVVKKVTPGVNEIYVNERVESLFKTLLE